MRAKFRRLLRAAVVVTAVVALGMALAGCESTNYAGTGNGFVLDATVQHGGDQSVTVIVDRVEQAQGKAKNWFGIETSHQIHNNYSTFNKVHQVGVLTDNGKVISPKSLSAGEHLRIVGSIRDSRVGRTWESRPVYDTATVTG